MPPKPTVQANPSRTTSANSGQSNKRKQPPQGNNHSQTNPRAAKRSKLYESRSIAVQSPHAALQNGELNVQSFVNSMAFEINALDESMRRSRTSGTSRAFQRVPFTMRRRTAAHNYKRIPKRLHRRAQREMAEDNTPTVNSRTRKPKTSRSRLRAETARKLGILAKRKQLLKLKKRLGSDTDTIATRAARPKIRRNEPNDLPVTAPRYRKRQLSKTWLPTHMWHAKRARMTPPSEPLWGFSLPLTSTQKNYRPTHRVQWEKGAMAWDMSYMSTIGLFGKENIIQNILRDMGLAQESLWNDKGKRWRAGAVHWTGNLSRRVKNAVRFIGPATIIWNPQKALLASDTDTPPRQLFIRIHPSTFFETFNELLQLIKGYQPRPYIQDLRHEIGSIDVTGPDSTEALLGVLRPFESASKGPHASKFESLLGLRDPASLPLGALLAFSTVDPRLQYPPRKVQPPVPTTQQVQIRLMETISAFRKEEVLEPYKLFDRDIRFKASKLPSQKSLNRRREKAALGAALEPSSKTDPPIPLILLASRNHKEKRMPGTWTILLPWKCVQPVWYSLMHYPLSTGGNPAFGGLDEMRQITFERAQPWFPGDVPGTDAGNAWETRERQARQKAWNRKPKGKRVKWDSVELGAGRKGEVGVGWSCDFETLFSLPDPHFPSTDNSAAENSREDDDHEMTEAANDTSNGKPPSKSHGPLTNITYLPTTVFNSFSSIPPPGPLPASSVVTVSINMLGRGVVTTCARIYRLPGVSRACTTAMVSSQAEVPATEPSKSRSDNKLPANLRDQWLALRPPKSNPSKPNKASTINATAAPPEARRQALAQHLVGPVQPYPPLHPNATSMNGHPLCPDAEDLIGFVTTGSYNLRDGHGEAIAGVSAQCAMEEMRRYKDPKDPAARLCVVRDAGQGLGWLAKWELI